MDWTAKTYKQLAREKEDIALYNSLKEEKKKKAASYKPQAASALKQTQLKSRIKI